MRYFSTFALIILIYLLTSCSELYISIHESSEKSESSVKTKNCTLPEPCKLGKNTEFWVSKERLKAEELFEVYLKNPSIQSIGLAHIEGVSMYMGKIPISFEPHEQGLWVAEAMVGACNLEKMKWKIVLSGLKEGLDTSAPIFYTTR
ncbi:hypothetical protein [Pseudoalteromonas luteoviolacea]|uniref:Lipoprotein n=1 Tax=Pseudoalteromonas luteoviolacea H33 TaxID=1365251 RepID=A0A167GUT9_9GAMM|nr:hypothetical protein [Pseudoalteromonas luteoviolacea]KZN56578.1 hypothetical protein N476_00455 [Pseudoalteromonas luteoviolacea H33]KZN75594.1 hypothetical protein N477_18055 [Pseudoalteromonas luteoviolacea H33-S]MBQ4876456.1 hypothetical protein [Pseudoalteromonas luteoviolacea]MBQ4905087.1 hypothetical protein [Pseudoalteromonas luteoviolacea]